MNIENITFENDDTLQQTLTKIVQITELTKHKVSYVKVCKGANTTFVLRGEKIGRLTIKL
jgi:soluble P-type ATPase